MKKLFIYLLLFLSVFSLTGCKKKEEKDPNAPANLREVVGDIIKAKLDSDGNIVIKKSDITTTVTNISYDVDGVTIGLLAVRDSKGDIKVVVNTCQSCGGSPYAYFVQVGNKIQCQNCGNYFNIDELDNLEEDGCNPISIEEMKDDGNKIIIGTTQLKELKEKFVNWKGPKA